MLQADQMAPAESAIDAIADVLLHDGVCVLPTDSVYGLSCRATAGNPAHRRIFEIKERPLAQTLPLFIADERDLDVYGRDVPAWAHTLAQKYWPGALTLVVRASDRLAPEYVQQGTGTVALRVPDSGLVRALVRKVGALAQTSANTHGNPAATKPSEIEDRLFELADLVVDGECRVSVLPRRSSTAQRGNQKFCARVPSQALTSKRRLPSSEADSAAHNIRALFQAWSRARLFLPRTAGNASSAHRLQACRRRSWNAAARDRAEASGLTTSEGQSRRRRAFLTGALP